MEAPGAIISVCMGAIIGGGVGGWLSYIITKPSSNSPQNINQVKSSNYQEFAPTKSNYGKDQEKEKVQPVNNNRGISNFHELEERILLMKELLPYTDKISSEETGEALLDIFIKLFEKSDGTLNPMELNKAIECLTLIENFEIDNNVKEELQFIKSGLREMKEISSMRASSLNRFNDIMDTSKKENKPKNLYEQAQSLGRQIIVDSYRKIANERNIAPSSKTTDEKIIDIYRRVGTAFNEASKQRNEHIPAVYLNTIILKFFQVYEMGGDLFLDEHLKYEVNKYLNEGLRGDYKQELKLI